MHEALKASPPRFEEVDSLLAMVEWESLEATSRAKFLRLRGELYEARGEIPAAVEAYRGALDIYPRVGVKGRIQALEKSLR
jgi:hypothetical protein